MLDPMAVSADPRRDVVESAWRDQAIWSATAGQLKADLAKWRTRAAVAGVVGAFLVTLASALPSVDDSRWARAVLALAGAVVLAVVPYVVRTKLTREHVADWVRARSTSEALKEQIYRFLVGAPPFEVDAPPGKLIDVLESEIEKVQDLNRYAASVAPSVSPRPLELRIDDYVEQRVEDQIDRYYLPKARANADAGKRLRSIEFTVGLLAVVIGAVAGAAVAADLPQLSGIGAWVGVLTTAGAAVGTHIAASRYDHQAIAFFGTARRLGYLRDKWRADPNRLDPARIATFVDDCENAISSENEAWLAAWTRDEGATS